MERASVITLSVFFSSALLAVLLRTSHIDTWHTPSPPQAVAPVSRHWRSLRAAEMRTEHLQIDTNGVGEIVSKTVHGSKLRLIYLVGLEGTGHHYLYGVLDDMCTTATVPCLDFCSIAKALYPGLGNPKTTKQYLEARKTLRQEMETLKAAGDRLSEGEATMVGSGNCRGVGMMSYPDFDGDHKALQYVDFRILAEEAERAGVDLRLVYLVRPAPAILIADTVHRHFGGTFLLEARTLLANADVISSTFRELDPGFVSCFYYRDIASKDQADRVARFVAPTENMAGQMSDRMIQSAKHSRKLSESDDRFSKITDPKTSEGLIAGRLQQKLDVIERQVCHLS